MISTYRQNAIPAWEYLSVSCLIDSQSQTLTEMRVNASPLSGWEGATHALFLEHCGNNGWEMVNFSSRALSSTQGLWFAVFKRQQVFERPNAAGMAESE
jgi:hypothetical protein